MLQVGERAPDFVLPMADGVRGRFYGHAGGRPTAVVFTGTQPWTGAEQAADALRSDERIAVWVVAADAGSLSPSMRGWIDADGQVAARFGATPGSPVAVLLDANLRVVAVETADVYPYRLLALLRSELDESPPVAVRQQAPVLMVPRVIDPTMCAALIAQCRRDAIESGVEQVDSVAGAGRVDRIVKRRSDVTVADRGQLRQLSATIGRRLMPEIERAFTFKATRFEGFKIACYDEEFAGFFAPHRDNLTPSTAHRAFGLSINLNDDYGGGELDFPEYGNQRYRAPAGAAMVFSSALLHAVHPVVSGSRYVLLSFLYADPPA